MGDVKRVALASMVWFLVTAVYGGEPVPATDGAAAVHFTWWTSGQSGGCSGALIAPRAVLTAAHCVRTPRGRGRRVRRVVIGNTNGSLQRLPVASVHVHPDYDPPHPERGLDLAVLVLGEDASAVPLRRVGADDDLQGKPVRIWGFGTTRARSSRHGRLREARLELLSPFACFSGPVQEMARTRMCAASPTAGVCPGDSGAPVLVETGAGWRQLGVVSVAIDNRARCTESATVMTRVSAFGDWIDGVLP